MTLSDKKMFHNEKKCFIKGDQDAKFIMYDLFSLQKVWHILSIVRMEVTETIMKAANFFKSFAYFSTLIILCSRDQIDQ